MKTQLPKNFQECLKRFSATDLSLIEHSYNFAKDKHAGQKRISGKLYIVHPLRIAENLARDGYDAETIAAGFLHDTLEDTVTTEKELEDLFGPSVAKLVDGVTTISSIKLKNKSKIFSGKKTYLSQVDDYRKVLFAATLDPRVMILKLYDRLDNIETIKYLPPEKIQFYARETIEIFAPIAERLGMGLLKKKLEDLAFPHAYPDEFKQFKKEIKTIYHDPEKAVIKIIPEVKTVLKEKGIDCEISGRAKGLYSLYKKIQRKGGVKTIYDIIAMRIIAEKVSDCYQLLGIIHSLYEPLPGEIDDYIARPKSNGYRSIHTTVKDKNGNIFEVQIRTKEMHEQAEYGAHTAHWHYKESAHRNAAAGQNLVWAKELEKLKEIKDNDEFLVELKEQLFADQIFVFSPKGDLIRLPKGSTVIDFAYRIHSDLGNHMIGAKINGRIVSITSTLTTGDIIEIIVNKNAAPKIEWLKSTETSQAKQHIRAYIRKEQEESLIKIGLKKFKEGLQKYNLEPIEKPEIDHLLSRTRLPFKNFRQALVSLGENSTRLIKLLKGLYPNLNTTEQKRKKLINVSREQGIAALKNIPYAYAKCCKPKATDAIIGYVARDHIVKVHKVNCKRLENIEPARLIDLY